MARFPPGPQLKTDYTTALVDFHQFPLSTMRFAYIVYNNFKLLDFLFLSYSAALTCRAYTCRSIQIV